MAQVSQFVVPRDGKWAVRKTGSKKVTQKFATKQEAIEKGRQIAKNQRTELYIFGRDGRIMERKSY